MPSELTFRAQLVLQEQRKIYDHWCLQAGDRFMPSREDLNMNRISQLAQSLSLLKVQSDFRKSVFYSVGTRTNSIYGCNIKGLALDNLDWGDNRRYWETVYSRVIEGCRPRQGALKGAVAGQESFVLFWLRLPLSEDGRTVSDILCHDVPFPLMGIRSGNTIIDDHEDRAIAI